MSQSPRTVLDMSRLDAARESVRSFENHFKRPHLYLAYHAAFPLLLTPDLLYRLWANFQCDIHGNRLNIPWVAVADILLSHLCDEVGYELYEMKFDVRTVLLNDLKDQFPFGQTRIEELSDFLLEYVRPQLKDPEPRPHTRDFYTHNVAQAQTWAALVYTNPGKVALEFAAKLEKLVVSYEENSAELVRIASLTETFAEPLAEYTPLLAYAQSIGYLVREDVRSAVAQLKEVSIQDQSVEVLGKRLPIPVKVLKKIPNRQKRTSTSGLATSPTISHGIPTVEPLSREDLELLLQNPPISSGISSVPAGSSTPIKIISIFLAYTSEDAKMLEKIEKILVSLQLKDMNINWVAEEISSGTGWKLDSISQLKTADIILLMVSMNFLASDFCYSQALQMAIERHNRREAIVIPIILRPCLWKHTPFAKLQPLPKNGKSVNEWKFRDKAFLDIAEGIQQAIEDLLADASPGTTYKSRVREEQTPLPPPDIFPIDVQMSIFSNGGDYTVYIGTSSSNWQSFRIGLKPQDVKALNQELGTAFEQFSSKFEENTIAGDALATLAQRGNFAFNTIFSSGILRETISKILKTGSTIQILCEDLFIPWELLYDGPLRETDISRFWGMRNIISRVIIQEERPDGFASPVIQSARPRIGLIASDKLEFVSRQEIPALQKLHQNMQISLSLLRPLNTNKRLEELERFGKFLQDKLEIIHFACYTQQSEPFGQSHLMINNEFPIYAEDFYAHEFTFKHHPLVIFNNVTTGSLSVNHWTDLFIKRGARGVITTDFPIQDWFAAAFIEQLYRQFLSGRPIGEALLNVRRHFWTEQRNPLGLGYALYGSPSIRLAKSSVL